MTHAQLVQILTGFVGSIGFAILFNVRGKRLAVAAIGGLLSWSLFLVLSQFIPSEPVGYFIVAWVMSTYAEVMARILKTPTTTFITITLIPLIPGGSLYYTMAHAFQGDVDTFIPKAIYTLQLASALALGIIVSTTLTKVLQKGFHKEVQDRSKGE